MKSYISRWIDYLLWSVIVIIPSAISFFDIQNLFSPFKFPILICFSTIILILIVVYRKISWDFVSFCALIWLILAFIASINSYNQELAFIGFFKGFGRYEGFFSLLSYVILWFAAKNFLKINHKRILIWFIGLIPFAIYALIQYYGHDPLVKNYGFVPGIFSTIGNPNFVGSLALMLVVLSSVLFVSTKKWIYFTFSMLFFSTFVVCQTRSAWLAGALVLVIFLLYQIIRKRNFYFSSFLVCGFVMVCLILFSTHRQNSVIQKFKTITNELDPSNEYGGSGRLKIWSITQKIILANPYLGVGPENLRLAIKTEQPKLENDYYRRKGTRIDKAHNEYLHMAAICGIPALFSYLLLLGMSFTASLKSKLNSTLSMAIFLMVLAYVIQAFFNISVIAVAPVFWIFLGGLAGNRFESKILVEEDKKENQIEVV